MISGKEISIVVKEVIKISVIDVKEEFINEEVENGKHDGRSYCDVWGDSILNAIDLHLHMTLTIGHEMALMMMKKLLMKRLKTVTMMVGVFVMFVVIQCRRFAFDI